MVRATVDRSRLCIWSAVLSVSALLVAVAQNFSTTKMVRDMTLAAVAMGSHRGGAPWPHASGLCNAVALSKEDHQAPKVEVGPTTPLRERIHTCRRRVVFAENSTIQLLMGVRVRYQVSKCVDERIVVLRA